MTIKRRLRLLHPIPCLLRSQPDDPVLSENTIKPSAPPVAFLAISPGDEGCTLLRGQQKMSHTLACNSCLYRNDRPEVGQLYTANWTVAGGTSNSSHDKEANWRGTTQEGPKLTHAELNVRRTGSDKQILDIYRRTTPENLVSALKPPPMS